MCLLDIRHTFIELIFELKSNSFYKICFLPQGMSMEYLESLVKIKGLESCVVR